MPTTRSLLCLAAAPLMALAAAGGAVQAAVTELAWDAQDRFEHRATVPAGRFVEVCGALQRDERVGWRFEAAAPLDFNIHHHEGRQVFYAERRAAVAALQGELRVATPQGYCWMWTNPAATPVAMTLRLQRVR
jgi:hypothetical protein